MAVITKISFCIAKNSLRKVRNEIYVIKSIDAMAKTKRQKLDNPFVYQGFERRKPIVSRISSSPHSREAHTCPSASR